jgi:hypothetical protein
MHLKRNSDGDKKYSYLVAVIAAYVKYFLRNIDCLLLMATSSQNAYVSFPILLVTGRDKLVAC